MPALRSIPELGSWQTFPDPFNWEQGTVMYMSWRLGTAAFSVSRLVLRARVLDDKAIGTLRYESYTCVVTPN
jgi:hypothetical protein